mgnify:CR=1 FL=1
MIGIEDAAEEASSDNPTSRLGEVLKQFELANEEIESDVARLHNKLALATASLEHYLDDVEIDSSVSKNDHGTVTVAFPEGKTPAEALAAVQGIVIPDKTQSVPSRDGVIIRCLWGERYRDEVDEAKEVSPDGG